MEADNTIHDSLMDAVARIDVTTVKKCLDDGANPDHTVQLDNLSDGDIDQPDTPLKLVMFRISDCDLTDDDLDKLAQIATALLHYGADPAPAMNIAEARYGKFDPAKSEDGPFMKVWRIVADEFSKSLI